MNEKVKGCGRIIYGNKEFGTLNCGNKIGKYIKGKWKWNKELLLCKECKEQNK